MKKKIVKLIQCFCLFNSRISYEFYIFEGNQIMVNRDVKKMQEDGWRLAGDISTKFSDNGMGRVLIPLKRKIEIK